MSDTDEQLRDLLDHATEFQFLLFPEGHEYFDIAELSVSVEWRGPDSWAVKARGSCRDVDGVAEWEPQPSGRTDEFKRRFRFSRDEAVRIARDVIVPAERQRWECLLAAKATPARHRQSHCRASV